jgi:fluoroacetyl-CoA thioesterase
MKATLRPGVSRVSRLVVDCARTIGFLGDEGRTYSTPSMILDVEEACRDLILQHMDDGEDSVGTEVMIRHLAPTPLGTTVTIAVEVLSVKGRRIQFNATVRDEMEELGSGTHERFVIDKARTFNRLKLKMARLAARRPQHPGTVTA